MLNFLRTVLHPDRYHGRGKQPPFFEGWYFKLVDASQQQRWAIIPGIFLSHDPARHHAFVQVLDGVTGRATYHIYPAEAFWAAPDAFEVRIGPNEFSASRIKLALTHDERAVMGEVHFQNTTPWPVTLASPGIMGWYAWIPAMECYHGVVSLDHSLSGGLSIAGREIDFAGGRGYIEKDWGQSFPAAWVWMQTNHFPSPGVCLTASIAIIPWLRSAFPGFIVGLWHDARLYRFATYTGARTEHLEITDTHVIWTIRDRHHRLEMTAERAGGGLLLGPTRQEMHKRVNETLGATVGVRLTTLGGRVIFDELGRHAGMEVHGELDRLLALQR